MRDAFTDERQQGASPTMRLAAVVLGVAMVAAACGSGAGTASPNATAAPGTAAPGASGAQATEEPIDIGLVTELSGPISLIGEAAVQAAELAVDEVNAEGGVLGRKLALKISDDGTDPTTAVLAWEKLVSEGVDAFVFRETSAQRVAVLPVAEKNNIPAIYANSYEGGDCRPILYTSGLIDPQRLKPYLQFLQDKGASKIFFQVSDINWGRINVELMKKAAAELGLEVVGEVYTPTTTDYSPYITQIRNSGADTLVWGMGGGPDNVAFFKQAGSAGLLDSLKMVGAIALDDTSLAAVGGDAEGTYMVAPYFWTSDSEANQNFVAKLQEKYGDGTRAQSMFSQPAYDAVHLYALAVEKAGTTESSAVLKALSEVEFTDSPVGTIYMTPDRHAAMPVYVAQATAEGTYKLVDSLGMQEPPDQCNPDPSFGMPQ